MHGNHTGNADPLLLAAGEAVGRFLAELVHIQRLQALFHSFPDFRGFHAHVFRSEADVFFHHLRNDLVVWILEDHARPLADIPDLAFIRCIHTVDPYLAFCRIKQGIQMLGQCGFTASVMAQDHDKFPGLYGHIHPVYCPYGLLYISFFIPTQIVMDQFLDLNHSMSPVLPDQSAGIPRLLCTIYLLSSEMSTCIGRKQEQLKTPPADRRSFSA